MTGGGDEVLAVRRFVEARRERLVALCAGLVAADSAQPRGRTVEAAAVLAAFLREAGLDPELRHLVPEKPNLVCSLGEGAPHLVLNGHLDTLAAGDPADWSVPILEMVRADGRLTGLGIGNMKAGTAAMALAFVYLARRPLGRGRVTFTAVADEVAFGPAGAEWLLASDPGLRGDAFLNAEGPGDMGVAVGEKGLFWAEIAARGSPGQGMLAVAGSGAAIRLASVLLAIDRWNEERFAPPPAIAAVAQAGGDGSRLSVNVGRIVGGAFVSQAPTLVRAEVDFRLPRGFPVAALEARLDAVAALAAGVSWRRIKGWEPNWSALDEPIVAAVMAAAMAVRGEARPVVRLPASDGARWRALGVPAVSFGPQPGLASSVDDFVLEDHVLECAMIHALAASIYLDGGAKGRTS